MNVKKTDQNQKQNMNQKQQLNHKEEKKIIEDYIAGIIVTITITFVIGILAANIYKNKRHTYFHEVGISQIKLEEVIKKKISKHYNKYVITTKNATLYTKNNNRYKEVGRVAKNQELTLKNITIEYETTYFRIDGKEDYYIVFNAVKKINKPTKKERYKKYIPFDENIITKDTTVFYDENNKFALQINKSFNLPIIVKDKDKYGVEYSNKLLYVKKDSIKEIKESNNTNLTNTREIPVLNYHFFYNSNDPNDMYKCNQQICISTNDLKAQLDVIKNNNIFTPTMKELEMYIDKKINLPKSIVLTIDDGWRADIGSKIIAEYELNATVFIITSEYDKSKFENDYIEVHSHSNNLHNAGMCPGKLGGAIQCQPKDTLLKDLKTSREKLNNTTVFCYPFYEYNNYSIEVLKEAGFTMAFAGNCENGICEVSPGIDKFRLPRYVIVNSTTAEDILFYIN